MKIVFVVVAVDDGSKIYLSLNRGSLVISMTKTAAKFDTYAEAEKALCVRKRISEHRGGDRPGY